MAKAKNNMTTLKRFNRKLTGAAARLFAAVCEYYLICANSHQNDNPQYVPIFSRLSPQQRIKLVRDVLIGLCCENEPLPPETIQHVATCHAIFEFLILEMEEEEKLSRMERHRVRRELLELEDDNLMCRGRRGRDRLDEEQMRERESNIKLVDARGRRNKKKLDRKKAVGDGFKVNQSVNLEEVINKYERIMENIFSGPPTSQEERRALFPLNEDEKFVFHWRLLADEALQEDTVQNFPPFPPLCMVGFDWRCGNIEKWEDALAQLIFPVVCQPASDTEEQLVRGAINSRSYADPSQHSRIKAVDRNVDLLRSVYEKRWKPEAVGDDQRCIYALVSEEAYCATKHVPWLEDFILKCNEKGVDRTQRGDYQRRLEVYRELKPLHVEGLAYPYTDDREDNESCCHPSEYKNRAEEIRIFCSGPGSDPTTCCCKNTENLLKCSRCQVVRYCSRECQEKDWPRHKKECKDMALLRKDKKQIAEIARNL